MSLMEEAYAGQYLEPAFAAVRLASARTGTLQRATSIVDASGASLSLLSHLRVVKAVAKIGTSFYPEVLKKVREASAAVREASAALLRLLSLCRPPMRRSTL